MERGGLSGGFHGYLKVQCQTGASVTVAAADMTLTSAEMNHNNNHHNHHYPSLHSDQLNHSHENHTTTTTNNHHPSNMSTQLPAAPPAGPDHAVDAECTVREQDRFMPIANVIRIMRKILPPHAKISDDAKETIQECVSEYISFITGEANERCQREQRKTITAEDVLWAMSKLGFDDYIEPLTLYLHRYRELEAGDRGAIRSSAEPLMKRAFEFGTGGAPVPTQPSSLAAAVTFAPPPPLFHIGHHHHHHPYFGHPPPLPPAIATMNGFIKDGNGATVSSHGHAGAETRTNGNSNSRQASGRVVGQHF